MKTTFNQRVNYFKMKQENRIITFTYIKLLIAGILIILGGEIMATHIVGGNIYYRKIGPSRFEVTLELRRDCFLGSPEAEFDDPAAVGIFSSLGALQIGLGTNGMILFPFTESDTLSNIVVSDCGFEGTQVCVEEYRYIQEVTLPYRPGGYTLTYQRCCRNGSLNNIVDPLSTGASYTIHISEDALLEQNSSPKFKEWPPVYICANEAINFDHSALDVDGDSLVYKICTPKDGATFNRPKPQPPAAPPYDDVTWRNPYNNSNLLGGIPLQIDPNTGVITGTPNLVGQFLVGICVEEYRNGKLISTVNRDFQYNVRICSPPPTALFDAPTENCDGLTVPFTNNSIASNQFSWNFNYPSTDSAFISSQKDPTFTFPASGTYDVLLKVVRGSDKCADSIIQTINVFDADFNLAFDTDLNGCNTNNTVSYTLTDQSTINVVGVTSSNWTWTVTQGTNTQSVSGNPATFTLPTGDFSVKLDVEASNGCIGSLTKSFIYDDFDLQPDFEVALDGCSTQSDIGILLNDLSAENNPDYTISTRQWKVVQGTNTFDYNGDLQTAFISRADFNVTLYINATNGCTDSITKNYKIADFIPSVDFEFNLTGCSNDNNPLIEFRELSNDTVLFGSVINYVWNINGSTLNGPTVVYESINEDTVFCTLNLEFADGCFSTISKKVTIDEIRPQVGFTWEATQCLTDETVQISLTFDDSKTLGYDFGSVNWAAGVPSATQNLSGLVVSFEIPKDSLFYASVMANFTNGCSDMITNTLDPGTFATVDLEFDTLVLCPLERAQVVLNPNPMFTYTWTPTTGLDLTDPSNPVFSVASDTKYKVVVSDGLCSVEDSIFIDVLESIPLTVAGSRTTCDGTVSLTVSGGVGPGRYEWANTATFANILHTGETYNTSFVGKSRTYYVRFVGEVCEALPTSVRVTNETPELEFFNQFEMCPNDTFDFKVFNLIDSHDLVVNWLPDPHIIGGGSTLEPIIVVQAGETMPFDLYLTVTNQFGCTLMDTLTITIGSNPIIDFEYEVVNCDTYEVCFKIVGDYNGFPIWDLGDTTTTNDVFLTEEICYVYPGPGSYSVQLRNNSSTCPFATLSKTITLNERLEIFITDTLDICIDSVISIPVPSTVSNLNFTWCNLDGSTINSADPLVITIDESKTFVLKVEDNNGCPFADTIHVRAFDFEYTLNIPEVFCINEPTDASINVLGDLEYGYVWSPSDCVIAGLNSNLATLQVDRAKTITVQVTHPTLGCVLTESFDIEPTELIIDAEAIPDAEIYEGNSVDIQVVDQVPGYMYEWSNGVTTGTQTVSPTETTTYTVTVTDEDGCMGEASVTIVVINPNCEEDVYIPNAFTPNGDEINDILFVRSNFIESMELIIYNRWNEEVFRSTNIQFGWNGTYKNEPLSPDAYAYWLTATCVDGFTIRRQGNINLIR